MKASSDLHQLRFALLRVSFQPTAAYFRGSMRLFLAVVLLVTSSSGESPAVQVALGGKALQYGKAAARPLIRVLTVLSHRAEV